MNKGQNRAEEIIGILKETEDENIGLIIILYISRILSPS